MRGIFLCDNILYAAVSLQILLLFCLFQVESISSFLSQTNHSFIHSFLYLHHSSRISQNSSFSANSSHDFGIVSFNSFNSSRYRICQSFPSLKQSHSQSQSRRFGLLSTSESFLFASLTVEQYQWNHSRTDSNPTSSLSLNPLSVRYKNTLRSNSISSLYFFKIKNKQKRSDSDSKPRFQFADSEKTQDSEFWASRFPSNPHLLSTKPSQSLNSEFADAETKTSK